MSESEKQPITEMQNELSRDLDRLSVTEAAVLMNRLDSEVPAAVGRAIPQIVQVVEAITAAFGNGGRLIYCGAGTSGRLGVLDASECLPTFGVSPDTVIGKIAGGDRALRFAVEDAEDSPELGYRDMTELGIRDCDVLVAVSAGGRARYCIGALDCARGVGAFTASIVCVPDSELSRHCDITIEAITGPEILSGSTRLKAGTATKMVLNMLSTLSMVQIGKVYQNFMVDMQPTNLKLRDRAIRIVQDAAQTDRQSAQRALEACDGNMKTAIVCLTTGCGKNCADAALESADGFVRRAIESINGDVIR